MSSLEFRAPTRSWASGDGKVGAHNWLTLEHAEIRFMASLVDVAILAHPKDQHKTGKIYSSRLEMKGKLRRVPSTCGHDTHDMFFDNIYYDNKESEKLIMGGSELWGDRNARGIGDGPELYYMPVRSIRELDPGHLHWAPGLTCECGIVGLLLMKVDGGFERVGLFEMTARHWMRCQSKSDRKALLQSPARYSSPLLAAIILSATPASATSLSVTTVRANSEYLKTISNQTECRSRGNWESGMVFWVAH